jgi:3-methyl-2-oxobutanoate hydroxymethyltransferase
MMASRGIPVCAHLGLTPQSVHALGGYRVQGRTEAAAERLKADALALQAAGASMLVLEMVPAALAAELTEMLTLPTIGIGAGKDCAGQVLVLHDLLGVYPGRVPKFARNFMDGAPSIRAAIEAYVAAVQSRAFPAPEHSF